MSTTNKRSMEEEDLETTTNKVAKTDETVEQENSDFSDDGSEYDDDDDDEENLTTVKNLPEVNSEIIVVPLLHKRSQVKAYINLIKHSPLSKGKHVIIIHFISLYDFVWKISD